jgi:hypothetical protein
MTAIQLSSSKWLASILITENLDPSDIYHALVRTEGETASDALDGAKFAMDVLAKGRTAYLRCPPEVSSETDFDTKITKHAGFARFSFKLEPGDWQVLPPPQHIPSIGSAA